jgi:ABC-type phosphate/phosphonate transport system substrate-binding protein
MSTITIGAVAYDPKAVTIWEAIRDWFRGRPVRLDYVLYSSYEAQVEALFKGHVDVAWNTNVAWVRCARRDPARARAIAMRDTDQGFTSRIVARPGLGVRGPADLRGKTVAFGSRDSGQAAILPVKWLHDAGLAETKDYRSLRFDLDVGKHGDTGTSELEVVKAIVEKRADAGFVGDSTWAMLLAQGQIDRSAIESVWTSPGYDHCNFTVLSLDAERERGFLDGLLTMDYAEPQCRRIMDLEGLKRWVPGRTEGYRLLEAAMREQGL